MNNIKLTTDFERDIGVIVNKNMKPTDQCTEAARRASAVLWQIGKSFHYRDRRVFIQIYKQYVRPHLEVAIPAWSPWLEADKKGLEKVQQKAVGMVSGLTGRTYEEKLAELGLLSLENRRKQYDLVQAYKIIRGFDDVKSEHWFNLVGENPMRVTRFSTYKDNIVPENPNTDIRRHFFTNRVTKLWNDLPSEVKESRTIGIFKNKVQTLLLG